MASTIEMWLAGIALLVNTLIIITLFFIGDLILAPIINTLSQWIIGPQTIQMWDITYIMPFVWILLLVMEIVCVISFFIVSARRVSVDDFMY
jgi:hypothetical protein